MRTARWLCALPLLLGVSLLAMDASTNRRLLCKIGGSFDGIWRILRPSASRPEPQIAPQLQAKRQALIRARRTAPTPQYAVGKVIYRARGSWTSSLWIDIGSESSPLIAKNSPVVSGDALIGVIDYVGPRSSLVRLITDPMLAPAVRVARGEASCLHKRILLAELIQSLRDGELLCPNDEARDQFLALATTLMDCNAAQSSEYLAKGELQGQGNNLLKGAGFTYDHADQHGPARDLRTGDIVQVGDLLVTSGLDGIFPEGLPIATVNSIAPLHEGAYGYELLAKPAACDIHDVRFVTVLPAQPEVQTPPCGSRECSK